MLHVCTIKQEREQETWLQKCKRRYQTHILISPTNPVRLGYFKSELAIRREQERHLEINKYAIHPFSAFRGVYEIFLVFLYTMVLLVKPMSAFLKKNHYIEKNFFKDYTIVIDFVCWVDIVMTFFTGFTKQAQDTNTIELQFGVIAKNYIFSPYFICDVLSSFPKGILYLESTTEFSERNYVVVAMVDIFMFLKFVRVVPLFVYIYRSAHYLQVKSKTCPFLTCTLLTTLMIIHWTTCLQFGVPRMTGHFSEERKQESWVFRHNIHMKSVAEQYSHSFLRSSSYILGIRQNLYGIDLPEEYLIALVTYFIGKLLVAFVWLILAMAILNARSIDIKFLELINQLDEYMRRKMLPLNLRERISQHYNFKYQKKYFKEDLIKNSLSGNIKKEVQMHICKTMIKNVSIFSDLTNEEVSTIVECLVPEIFLPQDTIIQHGTYGDAMFFLSSGTVAVYTRSGKEICHLQDGAYFGEISLLLPDQTRNASIVAIETSQVYRLKKRDFERHLLRNKKVLEKIMWAAEERLRQATQIEDAYKKYLFEQTLKATRFSNSKL